MQTEIVLHIYRLGVWGAAVLRPYKDSRYGLRCERCARAVRGDTPGAEAR
jgi:hypothetical protein